MQQSHAETMLAAIESVLEGRITADVEQYSINGRSIAKIPFEKLIVFRDKYRAEVASEQAALRIQHGMKSKHKIRTRF